MRRPPLSTAFPLAPVLAGLLAVGSTGVGQGPVGDAPKGPPGPAADLERFRALDPAERLRAVEAHSTAKNSFRAAARGDVAVAIVERGSLDAATVADLACQLKARNKDR